MSKFFDGVFVNDPSYADCDVDQGFGLPSVGFYNVNEGVVGLGNTRILTAYVKKSPWTLNQTYLSIII